MKSALWDACGESGQMNVDSERGNVLAMKVEGLEYNLCVKV